MAMTDGLIDEKFACPACGQALALKKWDTLGQHWENWHNKIARDVQKGVNYGQSAIDALRLASSLISLLRGREWAEEVGKRTSGLKPYSGEISDPYCLPDKDGVIACPHCASAKSGGAQ
jgi:hypothetical protein